MSASAPVQIRSAPAATPKDYMYVRIDNKDKIITPLEYSKLVDYINNPFLVLKQKFFLKTKIANIKVDRPFINIIKGVNVKLISFRKSGKDAEAIQQVKAMQQVISAVNDNPIELHYKKFIKEHMLFSIKKDHSDIKEIIFDLDKINCKQTFPVIPYSELKVILDNSLKKQYTTRPKTLAEYRASLVERKVRPQESLAMFKKPLNPNEKAQIRLGTNYPRLLPKYYEEPKKDPVKKKYSYNIPEKTLELDERLRAALPQSKKSEELVFTPPKGSKLTFQTEPEEGSALKKQRKGPSPLKRLDAMSQGGGRKRQNKYYM
jgi:hypothetical protein